MSAEPPNSLLQTAPDPNWESITEEIRCPLCDYNLRGLIEPRCPECGYKFAWPELIDPAQRLHPYLFEHHPERRLWSFRRTLTAGLRPRRFWKTLHPAQPSFPRRLVLYAALVMTPIILVPLANLCGSTLQVLRDNKISRPTQLRVLSAPGNAARVQRLTQKFGSINGYLDRYYPADWNGAWRIAISHSANVVPFALLSTAIVIWPWATLAGLLVFQISMKRAKVRAVHVLRTVCYCSNVIFWVGVLSLPAGPVLGLTTGPGAWFTVLIHNYEVVLTLVAWHVFCYRLIVAYRSYLRFRGAIPIIIASQVVAALIVLNVLILIVWL